MLPPRYRRAKRGAKRNCGNCGAFLRFQNVAAKGHCTMYNRSVDADHVCAKWYAK